jgi:ABC-type multidrug transport system fused ATPase/permease subunit
MNLEKGIHTILDEFGTNLSVGQRINGAICEPHGQSRL